MEFQYRKRLRRMALLAILVQPLCGCSQSQHRLNADREAYCTIAERNNDPRWAEHDLGIEMNRQSRYFDPYNPDCSPMPMDDPASHEYMHCVDGKKGWKHWGRNGVRSDLENPQWRVGLADYAELTEQNEVKLDVDSAVRLAYVHSPLNQNALETLYLTSLDVTGERFRLDTQFFGGTGVAYQHVGHEAPSVIGFNPLLNRYVVTRPPFRAESNRLTVTNDLSASRRFATAGEVLVGFANSLAFEFTGDNISLASSLANFSFVQPLLRGAGRDVALEQLTLSERRLLANLRAYSQFRQGFYTQIVIGELGVSTLQRSGPTTTLQSFSGTGGVNGYLGLLQQAQRIRYTEDNLRLQLRTLDRLEALYENELIDIVQVDQFRQNIETTRSTLLDQRNALELSIDNFTTQTLGLPSDLPIELDQELMNQFQLIPTDTTLLTDDLLALQKRIGNIGELISLTARIEILSDQIPDLAEQDAVDVDLTMRQLKAVVDAASRQLADLPSDLSEMENADAFEEEEEEDADGDLGEDFEALSLSDEDREELAEKFADASLQLDELLDTIDEDNLAELVDENSDWMTEILSLSRDIVIVQSTANDLSTEPEQVLAEAERLIDPAKELFAVAGEDLDRMEEIALDRERLMSDEEKALFQDDRAKLFERLGDLESGDAGLEKTIEDLEGLRDEYSLKNRDATIRGLTGWIQSYLQLVERLALIPAQARLEIVTVDDVELEPEAAFQIALENRLDFMNGRAALVDRWRAIQVAADALQSNLSVTGGGDIQTLGNNPVDFRASTGTMRLGIEFDAPLARLLERNGYRESLIQYQRNRRSLIQSQDRLQLGLRALLRTLQQRKRQLEIQRRAVTIALRRVDQTQLSLLTPPPQGQPGARPQISPTTAINLLAAQGALQTSQNSFLAAWLNYYAARIRLFRELGVMQLDPDGKWIENAVEFESDPLSDQIEDAIEMESQPEAQPLPPPLPIDVLEVDFAGDFAGPKNIELSDVGSLEAEPVNVAQDGPERVPEKEHDASTLVKLVEKFSAFNKNR